MVDDDTFNIKVMVDRLTKLGFVVDSAANGQIAVDQVKLKKMQIKCCFYYKFIIMDIDMPIKDGF